MFVGPAFCTYPGPKRRFVRTSSANLGMGAVFSRGRLDRPVQHAAYLDWSVGAGTQQVQRGDSGQRADFVQHLGPAVEKETLDRIQRRLGQRLEGTEAESLSDRGVNSIEDRVRAATFNPLSAAAGE